MDSFVGVIGIRHIPGNRNLRLVGLCRTDCQVQLRRVYFKLDRARGFRRFAVRVRRYDLKRVFAFL